MRYLILLLIWACFALSGCNTRPHEPESSINAFSSDTVLQSIYHATDLRSHQDLLPYLNHETAAYRMAAARCAASMTDSLLRDPLSDLLRDPVPYVRLHAAFAVGQYRDTILLPGLEKAIKKATIPEIKSEVLVAIGKCSNRKATEYLIFHEPNTAVEEAGKIWAIYYAMLRGNLQKDDLRIIVAHLKSKEQETRLAAAHILSRQNEFNLSIYKNEVLEAFEKEESGEIRAVLTRGVKHIGNTESILTKLAEQDPDSRVRAEAINILPTPYTKEAIKIILQSLEDGSAWVAMSAAKALSKTDLPIDELSSIAYLMEASPVPEVRAAIAGSYLNSEDPRSGWNYWSETQDFSIERAVLIDFFPKSQRSVDTLLVYSLEDSPVGTSAFNKLTTWHQHSDSNLNWTELANEAFSRSLIAQSYIAAEAMLAAESFEKVDTSAVLSMYKALNIEGQVETRNSLKELLKKLQVDIPEISIQGHQNLNWNLIKQIPKSSSITLFTDQGEFELSLLIEDAPGSVANIISHAQHGGYDSTYFHRVVPVFVSQGGGPRGDGFGSTDHTIRSEFSNLQFGPGVVGLASAGQDTESCQFFITHLSTPHLNGRYTIVGTLNSRFSNLENITSGTRIDSVKVNM